MKEKQENKAAYLPTELYSKIEERVKSTEFDTVDEYVTFVLEEVLKEEGEDEEKTFSPEEEEEVKKRLRDLGYLD